MSGFATNRCFPKAVRRNNGRQCPGELLEKAIRECTNGANQLLAFLCATDFNGAWLMGSQSRQNEIELDLRNLCHAVQQSFARLHQRQAAAQPRQRNSQAMGIVFISYSHKDSKTANAIARLLDGLGISYFRDKKSIHLGTIIDDEVKVGLDNCAVVVVVISRASLKSHWVPYEIGHADALQKVILPFLTRPSLRISSYLSKLNCSKTIGELRRFFSINKFPVEARTATSTLHTSALKIADRNASMLAGRWTGEAHQTRGPGGGAGSFEIDIKLAESAQSVSGEMVLSGSSHNRFHRTTLVITGCYVKGRFCWANYFAKSSEDPHFGTIVLDLIPNADKEFSRSLRWIWSVRQRCRHGIFRNKKETAC